MYESVLDVKGHHLSQNISSHIMNGTVCKSKEDEKELHVFVFIGYTVFPFYLCTQ